MLITITLRLFTLPHPWDLTDPLYPIKLLKFWQQTFAGKQLLLLEQNSIHGNLESKEDTALSFYLAFPLQLQQSKHRETNCWDQHSNADGTISAKGKSC